jgi:hypothetical protein
VIAIAFSFAATGRAASKEMILHSFQFAGDRASPQSESKTGSDGMYANSLAIGATGNLYGTAGYSILTIPEATVGNFIMTAGSCPGMIRLGVAASCFMRSWARRFEAASSVAAMDTCFSRFS